MSQAPWDDITALHKAAKAAVDAVKNAEWDFNTAKHALGKTAKEFRDLPTKTREAALAAAKIKNDAIREEIAARQAAQEMADRKARAERAKATKAANAKRKVVQQEHNDRVRKIGGLMRQTLTDNDHEALAALRALHRIYDMHKLAALVEQHIGELR